MTLFHGSVILPYKYLGTQLVYEQTVFTIDCVFDPEVFLGHCDQIS